MVVDFRLKVFQTVAEQLSYTTAARMLYISQPAVSKHINELEKSLQKPLFNRTGRKISLTKEGALLLSYSRKILSLYEEVNETFRELNHHLSGLLRIGASTTIAQYILPPILAGFKRSFPKTDLTMLNANTNEIEHFVLDKKIEIGITEGRSSDPALHYEDFIRDEIVLVTRLLRDSKSRKGVLKLGEFRKVPLILRENGSGTLDVVLDALSKVGMKRENLNVEAALGSSESIKSYLLHSDAYSFLSIHTILEELRDQKLRIVDVDGLEITRMLRFVTLHGQNNTLLSRFKNFCSLHYSPEV